MTPIRVILNGKKAALPELREAINQQRKQGAEIQVRVTWEAGDMERLVSEAVAEGVRRLVVGGGDGTVNEVVTALNRLDSSQRPELAVIPLGTANDFATATRIPTEIDAALSLALSGAAFPVDSIQANDRNVMNIATAGFGAQITAQTPVELKNFFGGGAYTLTGVVKALGFKPYSGRLTTDGGSIQGELLVGAFCNGRQAGGGQLLAPEAMIDDGLMDLVLLQPFSATDLGRVIDEIKRPGIEGDYFKHTRASWLEIDFPHTLPVNLDGEPYHARQIRFEVLPGSIKLVLPDDCPCLSKNKKTD